jgi:sortase A
MVIVLSMYALLLPFLAAVDYWWKQRNPEQKLSISRQLVADEKNDDTPRDDRLLIPSILVDEPIATGNNISVINDGGVWLRPQTAAPDVIGNTVLAGHRFTYQQPNGPLYHLDKMSLGDEIGVRWQGETTRYIVTDIKTVSALATDIELPTDEKRLTLYTCTPLLTAENRLVILAEEVD